MISRRDLICLAIGATAALYGMVFASFRIWAFESRFHDLVYNSVPRSLWWTVGAKTDVRFGTFEDFSVESGPRNDQVEPALLAFLAQEGLAADKEITRIPGKPDIVTYTFNITDGVNLEARLRDDRATFQAYAVRPTTDKTGAEAVEQMRKLYRFLEPPFPDHAISEIQINNERSRYSRAAQVATP